MRVVPCVLGTSSDFICVDIFNNSDFRISCGTYYDFQQFRFNKWVDIDFGDMAWEAGIYYINRKTNKFLQVNENVDISRLVFHIFTFPYTYVYTE